MAIGPGSLVATAISSIRIDLAWTNRGDYDTIHIERRVKDTPPWVEINDIGGEAEYTTDDTPPLTPEETYEYRIRGKFLYPGGEYSDYSNTAEATTPATLAPPSLCVATAFSDFIEITWKDNSSREDSFRIARNKDAAGWVEDFATIPANMDYYRDEAVVAGSVYQYRVLAKDGDESSDPSNIDSATAFSAPDAPTNLAISEITDESMRLTWTGVEGETGYKVEKSDTGAFGGEEEEFIVGADVLTYLAKGLLASTQYWFRVRAYNGVGNSAYDTDDDTTLAAYVPTEFEKWIRRPSIKPIYLAEIYTKMDIKGFPLMSDDDLVGCWPFDEGTGMTAYDHSKYGNHGSLENMAEEDWVDGKVGKALDFDGENDYVDCGDDVSLDITTAITITAWIKTSIPTVAQKCIISKIDATDGYSLEMQNHKLKGFVRLGGVNSCNAISTTSIDDQEWHFCVFTNDGTTIRIYVDGTEEDSHTEGLASIGITNQRLWIGEFDNWSGYFFPGLIDEVRIYNRALTEAEIKALHDTPGHRIHEIPVTEERGIDILEVFEDGESYTKEASKADVQANAESFYFDYNNRKLYLHTSANATPSNFLIEGAFWLYFSTHKDIEFSTVADQISACDVDDDWAGTALSIDTDDKQEGTGSLKDTVAAPTTPTPYSTTYNPTGSWDWVGRKYISFWLKCDRANAAFENPRVYIYDTAGNNRYWDLTFSAGEWTAFEFLLSTGDGESGTPPDLTKIDYVRVRFVTTDNVAFYKKIDDLRVPGRLNHFLPLLAKEDIPDITQEIKPYFEGSFSISSGSIAFMNAEIKGEHFFDKKFATYTWINAKVILKAGSDSFTYAQFKEIFTAHISKKSCSDAKITFQLRDIREDMKNKVVLGVFDTTNYPRVEEKFRDKPRPIYFGFQALITPVCIDEIQEKFQCNDGRIKSVDAVFKNGLPLVKDKHYYVDYQRARITFDRDGAFTINEDINDKIDFDEGGGELWATLDPATYTTAELIAHIQTKMRATGAFLYEVTIDSDTKKITIAAPSTFSLLWKSGTHGSDGLRTDVGATIGYAENEDSEGETSYEADADVISIHHEDIIGVRLTGIVDSADDPIVNGAEIFKYLMNNYKSLTDSELNLDSIYEAKYGSGAYEKNLSVPIERKIPFDEIVRSIEHSIESYTFQDEFGRLGIRPQQTVVASNVKYVISSHIFDHTQKKDRSSLFWKVNIYYNKDLDDNWEVKTATDNNIYWKYKITEELPIYTFFSAPAHALALATSILSLLNKEQIEVDIPMTLFGVMPGDLIKFSRVRFYDTDGTASEITLRVIRISKSPASGRTLITAGVVS